MSSESGQESERSDWAVSTDLNDAGALPEVARDDWGVPTFVFEQPLPDDARPARDKKTLEVVLLWREAVISCSHFRTPQAVTIGDGVKNTFRIAAQGLKADQFPLLGVVDGEFAVQWTDTMACEVRADDGVIYQAKDLQVSQADAAGLRSTRYKVGLNDRVAVQVGELTFVIQYVAPVQAAQIGFLKTIDFYFTKVLSLSFMAHIFLVLAVFFTPTSPSDLEDDLFNNENRFTKLVLKEEEKPKPDQKRFELSGSKGGGRHKDEEGKFGKPDKDKKDALASTKGAPTVDPNKREEDRKIVMNSGIFAALKGGPGGAVSNVFGPGGLGTGINNALGGLRGAEMGDAGGAGGLGTRGTGPGGGGNSLGIGGLGAGTGRGTGGLGEVDLGGRGKGKYKVIPGREVITGCMTQQVVLRVLNRAQNQAKYCYEKELSANPNLAGKVTTTFQIGPAGSVDWVKISANTMGNQPIEGCLQRVVQRLQFPPCKGGGTAEVTYPWIFQTSGE